MASKSQKQKDAEYYIQNKERILAITRAYKLANKEAIKVRNREYNKRKREEDPLYKFTTNLKIRTNHILRGKRTFRKTEILSFLGCSDQELREHLESQFKDGMNWENYGPSGWHIDHIIPISSAKTEEEATKLTHFSNLQPLWAKENRIKSNKVI